MVEKKRRSIFNPEALREAFERVFAPSVAVPDGNDAAMGGLGIASALDILPNPSRRGFLKLSGGAALLPVINAAIPLASHLAPEAAAQVPAGLTEAVDSYLGWRDLRLSHVMVVGQEGTCAVKMHEDLVKRLFEPEYRKLYINPAQDSLSPLAQDAAEATGNLQRIMALHKAGIEHSYAVDRFVAAHPEHIDKLTAAINERMGLEPAESAVGDILRHSRTLYADQKTITARIGEITTRFRANSNKSLYMRFGTMLPDTTADEAAHLERAVAKDLRADFGDGNATIEVRKFAEDTDETHRPQPTYLLNMISDPRDSAQKQNRNYHSWLASMATLYPSEVSLVNDDESMARKPSPGKLLITPIPDNDYMQISSGVLITLPPGFEDMPQLAQLDKHLEEMAMIKKLPSRDGRDTRMP